MDSALSSTVPPFITDPKRKLWHGQKIAKISDLPVGWKIFKVVKFGEQFCRDFPGCKQLVLRHERRPKYVVAAVKIPSCGFLPPAARSNGGLSALLDKPARLRLLFGQFYFLT